MLAGVGFEMARIVYWQKIPCVRMEKCSPHLGKKSWMGILFEDDVC